MGGSRNLERAQERADNQVTSGQKRHGDDFLPPESRFSSAIELLFDMVLSCQLSHETLSNPLFGGEVFGMSPTGKRSDCGFRQAGLPSDCRMSVELVIRFPYRPNCEDHDLADFFTQRRVSCFRSLKISETGSHFRRK